MISKISFVVFLITVVSCLLPRQPAPGFSGATVFPDKSTKVVDLRDYTGKYVVLLFYPFDFTYVCPTELLAFSDNVAEFKCKNKHYCSAWCSGSGYIS
jgi:alkyl hydroperoxide reductase subunit AhpC